MGSSSIGIPEAVYLQWLGMMAQTVQRNKEVTTACLSLCESYAHDGMLCCVLKGLGNLEYYPEELGTLRTAGDIDVWCKPAAPCGLGVAVAGLDGKGAHSEKYTGIAGVVEYVNMLH